jgi:nucleotide-binding universal stress UspA family protein
MIQKLLIAYDGSDSAKAAFNLAIELAGKFGAELHVLAVARPPEFGSEVETEAILENSRRHYTHLLQPLRSQVAGLTAHFEVMVGHPAESVVLYAEDHGIDHIVVGHRGHSLFERWLLGSVARQVIAYAPCAVTVVRPRG